MQKRKIFYPILLCGLLGSGAHSQTAKYPFPQNVKYPYGYMSASVTSAKTQSWYNTWKSKYQKPCNGDIMPTADEETVVKVEGMGWALISAAYMGDKTSFDGMYAFYKKKCTTKAGGMMGWEVTCSGFKDEGSASDGDLDVGFALVVAYWQWGGSYLDEAKTVIANCKKLIKNCSGISVLAAGYAGGAWGGCDETDMSYYTPAFFRVFAEVTNDEAWTKLADDTYVLLERGAHPQTGLVPDWQYADGTPGSSTGRETTYRYDASRVPWRLALDYLWNGNEKAKEWCTKVTTWANGIGPANIKDGYQLNGTPTGSNHNMAFTGAFAVGAMCNSQAIADNFGTEIAKLNDSYWYGEHLGNVYLLALTGNMWHEKHLSDIEGTYPLAVTVTGKGSVSRDPNAIRYAEGTKVTLTAEPAAGWAFDGWSGDGVSGKENPLEVTVNAETNITANFILDSSDPNSNLLQNGDFASELTPWEFNSWNNSTATGSVVDGEFKVTITTLGENHYDIQLVQRDVPLEQGKSYILTFDASATEAKTMNVLLQMPDDPWSTYAANDFELTTTKKTYTMQFAMDSATNIDARIGFNFGSDLSGVTLDNVRLIYDTESSVSRTASKISHKSGLQILSRTQSAIKIGFNPKKSGETVLKIFNLKGNLIESAKFQSVAGSSYVHNFNIVNKPNGFYVISVNNNGAVQQTKVMLTK